MGEFNLKRRLRCLHRNVHIAGELGILEIFSIFGLREPSFHTGPSTTYILLTEQRSCNYLGPNSSRTETASTMLGAIAGDIIGSVYEARPIKTTEFPLFHPQCCFTDDSVLTVAVAKTLLAGSDSDYGASLKSVGRRYMKAGYGPSFHLWLRRKESKPYNSWGNGSAMRASPIGMAFSTVEDVLREAERSAAVTHNHPEGIKGAQATALCGFLARQGNSKEAIKDEIERRFGYNLQRKLDDIRPGATGQSPHKLIRVFTACLLRDSL